MTNEPIGEDELQDELQEDETVDELRDLEDDVLADEVASVVEVEEDTPRIAVPHIEESKVEDSEDFEARMNRVARMAY